MFAILGINFMKGRMGYCADSSLIQSALISTNKTQVIHLIFLLYIYFLLILVSKKS